MMQVCVAFSEHSVYEEGRRKDGKDLLVAISYLMESGCARMQTKTVEARVEMLVYNELSNFRYVLICTRTFWKKFVHEIIMKPPPSCLWSVMKSSAFMWDYVIPYPLKF